MSTTSPQSNKPTGNYNRTSPPPHVEPDMDNGCESGACALARSFYDANWRLLVRLRHRGELSKLYLSTFNSWALPEVIQNPHLHRSFSQVIFALVNDGRVLRVNGKVHLNWINTPGTQHGQQRGQRNGQQRGQRNGQPRDQRNGQQRDQRNGQQRDQRNGQQRDHRDSSARPRSTASDDIHPNGSRRHDCHSLAHSYTGPCTPPQSNTNTPGDSAPVGQSCTFGSSLVNQDGVSTTSWDVDE